MKKISLFLVLTVISFIVNAQTFVSLSSEAYLLDSIKQEWVFGYKLDKETISVIIAKDTLYIDDVKFTLSKPHDIKENEHIKMVRYIAYNGKEEYHFDMFLSKKEGEQNIRFFYLTNNKINYRYFCVKLINVQ